MKKALSYLMVLFVYLPLIVSPVNAKDRFFQIQAIDTMKYSRDRALEKLNDPAFDSEIDTQIKNIADTGSTHVAIATPYDEQFLPFLKRWVDASRKYRLSVWFRGNWSGWEGWFDYPKIDRDMHIAKTRNFIAGNSGLFENNDIFTACPECEFGGPGDPRFTNDVEGFRNFLIEERRIAMEEFDKIHKKVSVDFQSMNTDVARLVLDKNTTKKLGGNVVIDHYLKSPEQYGKDIKDLSEQTGGKIMLGEFGTPIPDINGIMDNHQQAQWINTVFVNIIPIEKLIGVNYWVNRDGTTSIWDDSNKPYEAVKIITSYYKPKKIRGIIKNEIGETLTDTDVFTPMYRTKTDKKGFYEVLMNDNGVLMINNKKYDPEMIEAVFDPSGILQRNITLKPTKPSIQYRIKYELKKLQLILLKK